MAFQPVGKVFQRQKNAKFIVAGSAVLERILSIVDHGTGQCVLQLHLDIPDGGVGLRFRYLLLHGVRQFVDQQQPQMLVVVVLHHIHRSFIVAVILAVAAGKVHFYLFLLLEHPDEPVIYFAAHGKFVVRQKNAGIIRQDHRVRLTIGVEFERDQGSVP